ncbi:unnamed protein product [marine sediment metagenome]|uniref:Uncharacterized protein n=1 Tax=marine sediment metagenome TaxID=412755 RepID=X1BM70_9ZZZZ
MFAYIYEVVRWDTRINKPVDCWGKYKYRKRAKNKANMLNNGETFHDTSYKFVVKTKVIKRVSPNDL